MTLRYIIIMSVMVLINNYYSPDVVDLSFNFAH